MTGLKLETFNKIYRSAARFMTLPLRGGGNVLEIVRFNEGLKVVIVWFVIGEWRGFIIGEC